MLFYPYKKSTLICSSITSTNTIKHFRMKTSLISIIILGLFLFISCGREEYTEEGIIKIVEKTDSLLAKLAGQKYDWASAAGYSTVMAYYPQPDIIFINENLTHRKPGNAFNRYYFKDGRLIHFIGKKLIYLQEAESKLKKELLLLSLYLDPDGDIISYNKILNNQLVPLDDLELVEILKHADEVYHLVSNK